ncbi:MAG TPA: hybrid sensor histidine kinase/response regulator [Verrucomicrobiae bacterium]|nr:hybrid sensor histidine kinase/response regulator [Verrucomicrobiae bacterium]
MRVLIVEDNPADVALVRALLEGNASYTRVVSRLADAVAAVAEERFDVTLMDMSLPDGRGLDALAAMCAAAPHMPIVILSGQDDRVLSLAAVKAGAQDYQIKGNVTEESLRRTLRHAIERQQLLERLSASIDELESQRASVIRINQLKNDLISILAHDFKGPLTTILGYAELLEEGLLETDEAREAAKTITRNVMRLATLANDTLALSKVERGELDLADERVDVGVLLHDIVASIGPDAARVTIRLDAQDPIVRGDAARLRQAFENILRNALKYSREPDRVDVAVFESELGLCVDVTDRGIGIPSEEISGLFQRFARASNAKKAKITGTGLGLFLVKTLVDKHGGSVAVRSVLNEGTTFTITLPRDAAPAAFAHVSVLADDPSVGPFIVYALRQNGFRVRHYRSPALLAERFEQEPSTAVVVHADSVNVAPQTLRTTLAGNPRLIAIGGKEGWDAALPSSFLAADLLAALTPPSN